MQKSNVVLLVPGIFDRGRSMHRMQAALNAEGFSAHYIHLRYNSAWYGLKYLSRQLEEKVNALVPPQQSFSLVGFSMGGIVARHFMQARQGLPRVHKYISMASPHRGSLWANLLPYPGGRQLMIGSPLLEEMNTELDQLIPTAPVSIWTRYDATILPHNSAILPVGSSHEVPVKLHRWVPLDLRVISIVTTELQQSMAD
ncbi:Alpha/beta hydrolase family protein [Microbulbifer aggregans]|uniref:Alpha/beta hydrolase family protein n=1 Tax=Microbulbifer aggregans TaxID=1769779 RepID=A0A1C9W4G6_9GAMM|nr:lipase [Microbulbifer aggregans]AOS96035.1 Alpha/beta hydrolase family protein [Microbulbifer aggregans]